MRITAARPGIPARMPRIVTLGVVLACALGFHSGAWTQVTGHYAIAKQAEGSEYPLEMTFILTLDEVYAPVGIRKPHGDGPFPAVIMASGNGRGGMPTVERAIESLAPYMDEYIDAGYVVVYAQYRNEIPGAYNETVRAQNIADVQGSGTRTLKSGASLDSDDFIAIIEYVKALPYVYSDGVGVIGSSHGGELIMKAASEIDFGAGILGEPATSEYLDLDMSSLPPGEPQLQDKETARSLADKAEAMERIRRINTPMLFMGRESDHYQGLFALTHEWLIEAGKDSTWASFDHPRHGYVLVRRQQDGSYQPDDVQVEALQVMIEFLDRHLKPELVSGAR